MQVARCETGKEIWDSLKSRFIGTEDIQQAHSQQLKSEFERLLMKEDESIDSFAGKLMSIITKAATCGLTFDEQTKVRKVLNAVPDKFLPVVAIIEMIVDFKTVKFEEIIGKLKTCENMIKFIKESKEDNSEKLLLTRQRNDRNYERNYGNDRRGGGNQTQGRGKYKDEGHTSDESEGTDNKPRCEAKLCEATAKKRIICDRLNDQEIKEKTIVIMKEQGCESLKVEGKNNNREGSRRSCKSLKLKGIEENSQAANEEDQNEENDQRDDNEISASNTKDGRLQI
nr:putative zinc finger, CCHC-type [Tanacetum cinerariifolium]